MSGGKFEYSQDHFNIHYIIPFAEQLKRFEEHRLLEEDKVDPDDWEQNYARSLSEETMKEYRKGLIAMRVAFAYADRIDRLECCDDGEDSFHKRLQEDIEIAMISERNITNQFVVPEGKVIKVYEARSQFCRCIYAVGFDSDGYEERKTIYTIETKEDHRREHHADRMIRYLKEDFYGRLGSTATLNDASKALMQKNKIEVFDSNNPLTKKLEEKYWSEKFTATMSLDSISNKKY
jgi:hypothetical protein